MKLTEYIKKFDQEHPNEKDRVAHDTAFQIGLAIARARTRVGITQTELAQRVGKLQPSIARMESGESAPQTTTLKAIFDALKIPVQMNFLPSGIHIVVEGDATTQTPLSHTTQGIPSPFTTPEDTKRMYEDSHKSASQTITL